MITPLAFYQAASFLRINVHSIHHILTSTFRLPQPLPPSQSLTTPSLHTQTELLMFHSSSKTWCLMFDTPFCTGKYKIISSLTFRNLASYIQDGRKITLQMPHFISIQQISVRNILNMLYNLHFFSSKHRLFHNATLFGFCITHILNTGCAKI